MSTSTTVNSHYIHGSSADEQQRLSRLNQLMNTACLEAIQLRGDERILDMGSGLGQFSIAIAHAAAFRGQILGIERDAQQLATARKNLSESKLQSIEFRQGDAFHPPLSEEEWETFDVAHTRFLLEHLPQPERVVAQMVRAVRPGGRIILIDDDHDTFRLWPDAPGFRDLWLAYIRSYERLGNDPYIGRRLVSLLHQAGCQRIRNKVVFFGSCADEPNFDFFVENIIGILVGAKDLMLEQGLIHPYAFAESIAQLRQWKTLPDASIWYSMCYAEGEKRPDVRAYE